jgi:ATP-dependent DNA helicase RecG
MEVSRIEQMPSGRVPVSTFLVDSSYRERMNGFIAKQALEGSSVYVVCPAIEPLTDDDGDEFDFMLPWENSSKKQGTRGKNPMKNAVEYTEELRAELEKRSCFARVECLHGRMKSEEKDLVMQSFAKGEIKVLVSTTVIEVGVNVPSATLMIIENAERFGLSQLHQLRGRIGRGNKKSWCILVSDSESEKAKGRLEHLCRTKNGFEIAKYDLATRGPGDFLRPDKGGSLRQSGDVDLSFGLDRIVDPDNLVECVFAAARAQVENE